MDRPWGRALYAVDGTTMRVADSVENREHFGSQNAGELHGIENRRSMCGLIWYRIR